jgi:DNA-binding CsgD family transcriptional regulator
MTNGAPMPILGRDVECARLVDALAADGTVLVTGEAGIGKTTLVRVAVAVAGRSLVGGAGFATLASMPYLALRLALGSPVSGSPVEVARRVEGAVGDGVLFLDDLQWIDRDTRAVLPLVAGRIAVVIASRAGVADLEDVLPGAGVQVISLGPLPAPEAEALARLARDDLRPAALQRVLRRAGGNPLLIEELARDGRESPTVARAIAGHLAEASPSARASLRLLAVADRPLRSGPALAAAEPELLQLGLVARTGDMLAIRHGLIAEELLAELGDEERRAAHREVSGLVDDDTDAALHLARAGDREAAVARALAALERTADMRTRAALLKVAAEAADGVQALRLRTDAAREAIGLGDSATAADLLAPDPPPDASPEERALREALLVRACAALGRETEMEAARARAAELPLDPSGEAAHVLAVEEAILAVNRGDAAAGMARLDAARVADPAPLPEHRASLESLRQILTFFLGGQPDIAVMQAAFEEAVERRLPSAPGRAVNLQSVLLGMSGPAAALASSTSCAARLEAVGMDSVDLHAEQIQTLAFTGQAAAAVVAADELLEQPFAFTRRSWALILRAEAMCLLGRLADAGDSLRRAEPALTDDWSDRGEFDTVSGHVAYWAGQPREALARAQAALDRPTHYEGNYLLSGLIRAWAEVELGRSPSPLPAGATSWARRAGELEWAALDARAAGNPAMRAFEEAAAAWDGHIVFRSILCRWAAGDASRTEDPETAVDRLRHALADVEARGFASLAARIRRSLRLAGVRVAAPSARDAGVGLLTGREREVLDLVAQGMSNGEIARRLGLGRPTVTRILSNAMAKLGADSRAQAVTRAHAAG